MNVVDTLIDNTIRTKNPTVVGLDPDLKKIPACYKTNDLNLADARTVVADIILSFNRDVIDTVFPYVPAVKPQIAFYEKYGYPGVRAFEETVAYAKRKGLVVIEDGKRNDIGNTAKAYADGHLGTVELFGGDRQPSIGADFLTVSPYLGSESLAPFVSVCRENGKGIFVLVKTSNTSSGEIQDVITTQGITVSQAVAKYVAAHAELYKGKYGYSPVGAVVGATYPKEAENLREDMPHSYFLVPGYGAQGGGAEDVTSCFNPDGLGAIVNSSRGILYNHMTDAEREVCTKDEYLTRVKVEVLHMRDQIYSALKNKYPHMIY